MSWEVGREGDQMIQVYLSPRDKQYVETFTSVPLDEDFTTSSFLFVWYLDSDSGLSCLSNWRYALHVFINPFLRVLLRDVVNLKKSVRLAPWPCNEGLWFAFLQEQVIVTRLAGLWSNPPSSCLLPSCVNYATFPTVIDFWGCGAVLSMLSHLRRRGWPTLSMPVRNNLSCFSQLIFWCSFQSSVARCCQLVSAICQ